MSASLAYGLLELRFNLNFLLLLKGAPQPNTFLCVIVSLSVRKSCVDKI